MQVGALLAQTSSLIISPGGIAVYLWSPRAGLKKALAIVKIKSSRGCHLAVCSALLNYKWGDGGSWVGRGGGSGGGGK